MTQKGNQNAAKVLHLSKTSQKYIRFQDKQNYSVTGTNSCQVYTYENLEAENEYGSTLDTVAQTKPSLNNVFNDFVNGLNHTGGLFSCISEDQINAVNKNRSCLNDNSTHNKCPLVR